MEHIFSLGQFVSWYQLLVFNPLCCSTERTIDCCTSQHCFQVSSIIKISGHYYVEKIVALLLITNWNMAENVVRYQTHQRLTRALNICIVVEQLLIMSVFWCWLLNTDREHEITTSNYEALIYGNILVCKSFLQEVQYCISLRRSV